MLEGVSLNAHGFYRRGCSRETRRETSHKIIFSTSSVSKHREVFVYTLLNLLAEVGGYVGIMVGYSLLSFAEYLYERFKIK